MPKIQYIGKQPYYLGKSAFEILTNLKQFGIGRMLTRFEWDKYPEPSYYVIREVLPRMDDELLFGQLWVESVFRGKRLPEIVKVKDGYKRDYRLIHKQNEKDFTNRCKIIDWNEHIEVVPKYYTIPPLMKIFLTRHRKECGDDIECFDQIPYFYQNVNYNLTAKRDTNYRFAEPGEQTTMDFDGNKFNDLFLEGVKPI